MDENISIWHVVGVVTLWVGSLATAGVVAAIRGDLGIVVTWFIGMAICITFRLVLVSTLAKTDRGTSFARAFELGREAERRVPKSGPRSI